MTKLRAGVVGLGTMGRNHVRVLSELEDVELVGVADPDRDKSKAARGAPTFTTVEELIEQGLDICVIAAPTEDHEKLGLLLVDADVHALIEKPLANDLEGATRLTEEFEKRDLVGCVGHIERYNPALQALHVRLQNSELGEIFQIATRRQGPFPQRIRDVGVVKDLATHDVDLAAWVADSAYESIAARTAHKTGREHEDLVAATGVLENGIITNHLVNWLSPMKERVTVVTGDKGCFVADTVTADLSFHHNADVPMEWPAMSQLRGVSEGDMVRFAIPKPEPLAVELEQFCSAVRGENANVVTMRAGLAAVAVAEAVLESARTAQVVVVDSAAAI